MAYSFEMVLVGMVLLSAMVAGSIALYIRRRREAIDTDSQTDDDVQKYQ